MVLKDKNKLKAKKMAERFLQEIYPVLIERDSKGNIISREEMDEIHVNFVPRVGEIISQDTREFYQDEDGNNEKTEDGRTRIREIDFYRVLAVIHEDGYDTDENRSYCVNVIVEPFKGRGAKFLADCMYDKDEYFIEPKNFE